MKLKSIKQVKNLKGKKVLYRVAYDITLAKKGRGWVVPDNRRIAETLPTIKYLLNQGCSLVFLSWLKRPGGKVVEKYRMDPVARELANLTKKPVIKIDQCVGLEVQNTIKNLKSGELLMLENVRFYKEDKINDLKFSRDLTKELDLIVFDAFAQSHREVSSTVGIMKNLPAYSGLLLEKEIANLHKINEKPKNPLTIILGGAKISDKIDVMKKLVNKADNILIGGGLANIFLQTKGIKVANSYIEDVPVAGKLKNKSKKYYQEEIKKILKNKNVILPMDLVSAKNIMDRKKSKIVDLQDGQSIDNGHQFLDIGPKTIKKYCEIIKKSKTVLWNGPMGVFEVDKFSKGTEKIAKCIAKSKNVSVLGGGDTEVVVKKYNLEGKFTHVSTGGGAMLKFLEGKTLPAIKKLYK